LVLRRHSSTARRGSSFFSGDAVCSVDEIEVEREAGERKAGPPMATAKDANSRRRPARSIASEIAPNAPHLSPPFLSLFSTPPTSQLFLLLQSAAPAKESNPLYERRPKSFGVGGAPPPKGADLHRWVKWPRYVRLQRQRRVLNQRLKVPPALARFAKAADRNLAASAFKLLLKYRPEDKAEKKARLVGEAEARASGAKDEKKKKPVVVKFGLNHVTDLVESGKAKLVVIAHDVDPIELVVWLPALCKKVGVPYMIVKGKARLGAVVHQKTAAALALTEVKGEDDRELAKVVESANAMFLDGPRVGWGGGIMGVKSQAKSKAKERELARELAQRA